MTNLTPSPPLDAMMAVRGPDGTIGQLAIEAKETLEPRMVADIARRVLGADASGALIVAPFISPGARARLVEAGCGYADATGNLRLVLDRPAVFIEASGAAKNPWREERALSSLKGAAAGEVVRALCEFRPPFGVRELVQRADLAIGTVSRVVDLLARDATLTRDERGAIVSVDVPATIRRWARDYECLKTNVARTYLEPRGLTALLPKLAQSGVRHAVTASFAAVRHAPVAAPRLATIYVEDATAAADALNLKRVESGGNVLLVEPRSPSVFERSEEADGVTYAAPSQVAADLLTAPGRGPAEADALFEWMQENENAWRA